MHADTPDATAGAEITSIRRHGRCVVGEIANLQAPMTMDDSPIARRQSPVALTSIDQPSSGIGHRSLALASVSLRISVAFFMSLAASPALAAPAGYVTRTIALDGPPVGMAFAPDGTLYAVEDSGYGANTIALRAITSGGAVGAPVTFAGDDPLNFWVGGVAYDPIAERILVTDNTTDGRLYSLGLDGSRETIATRINAIAGVIVHSSGEIFVSTSRGAGLGTISRVDRATGVATTLLGGLDYGAGLTLDGAGNLLFLDALAGNPTEGRLWRAGVQHDVGGVTLVSPTVIATGVPAAAVAIDDQGDLFVTGFGGVFALAGTVPELAAEPFDTREIEGQFATAIAFCPGSAPFEPFAGPDGGVLAVMADFGFGATVDEFVTLFTPARPEDFDSTGLVDGADLAIWSQHYGAADVGPAFGDATQNGAVDGADFLRWQRATGTHNALVGSVPEPRAAWLWLGALVLGWAFRTRASCVALC